MIGRWVAIAGLGACVEHVLACKGDGTHVYVARQFVETRDCVASPSSVDVVAGDDPGTCEPVCLIQPRADGGRAVYVSGMCPPLPEPDFDATGRDPICAQALAAFGRGDTCLGDGGTTNPRPTLDAAAGD